MVQIQNDVKKLTCDMSDFLGLPVEVSESNLVNSLENAVLKESKLFSILG